ncbi:DUF4331 domain-containing protein [Paractinoplanes brasiliensis]|uniref:Uncharacterized protein DUF4331 n=1 Tax=Paractinoplanes brasiliensis TaxID=52695 RepID=A0A4R6JZF7_9ACTN|nr:DUF4331 domain-containing protein [Actinoplanes brasiliensis]TDO42179.1 uncharacterized protein DUF4331 [Actinoplanes brasiliensis]GID31954.1 hypothetical protein Abr02nite_69370 [Actinoplanes brasiliensis]
MLEKWQQRRAAVAASGAVVLIAALAGLGPGASVASSHREAPLIASDPAADNTDLYAFVSPDRPGYVTMIANWIPFEEPDGGPNFYPFATDAAYRINVDSDGDAKPDAVFRWTFKNVDKRGNSTFLYNNGPVTSLDDKNLLFKQTYTLESSFNGEPFKTRIENAPVAPSRIGAASMPDYQKLRDQATIQLQGGWKLFAGQADDPFFLDLRVFDLLYGGDLSETGRDTLAGYNVNSIAIQVPFKDVALNGDAGRNPVVGIWSTTERSRSRVSDGPSKGDRVQVSRLGNPLVNEVVVPAGLKDAFNSLSPDKDAGIPAVVKRVTDPELPRLIEQIYGVKAPATPRNDLVEIFLTGITTKANGPIKADLNSQLNNADVDPNRFRPSEMLRLNLSVPVADQPERLGVLAGDLQGFPNGRRLTDDAVDIAVQAVEGAAQTGKLVDALAAGDKVDSNDNAFGTTFPYVALPNQGAVNAGRDTGAVAAPKSTGPADSGAVDSGAGGSEAAPDLDPASNSSMLTNGSAVIFAVGGVGALLVMLTAWWLMKRRRRAAPPYGNDPTIRF